jgi:hypothetical protein
MSKLDLNHEFEEFMGVEFPEVEIIPSSRPGIYRYQMKNTNGYPTLSESVKNWWDTKGYEENDLVFAIPKTEFLQFDFVKKRFPDDSVKKKPLTKEIVTSKQLAAAHGMDVSVAPKETPKLRIYSITVVSLVVLALAIYIGTAIATRELVPPTIVGQMLYARLFGGPTNSTLK